MIHHLLPKPRRSSLLRLAISALAFACLALLAPASAAEMQGWAAVPEILKRINAPSFPSRDFDVSAYGARGDSATNCYPAFKAAIDACAAAGGGRVIVPAGTYLSNGPVHLKSNVNFHVAEGATILFGTNPDDYLVGDPAKGGGVLVRWEGTRCYNYSPLIYAYRQRNVAVTGKGTIDGQTSKGWAEWKRKQGPDQTSLRQAGLVGKPIEERLYGRGHFLRPSLLQTYECENVLIEGITVKASPFWNIHPVACTNVTVRGVTVQPGTTNDDGVNPESCTDVLIERCVLDTRDDNIAIKSGRDNDGWAAAGGRPSSNIIIRDCTFLRGKPGGVSIGSEMSGGVRNIYVEDCTMNRVAYAFYVKGNPERGGFVENFWARNVQITTCETLLKCEMDYKNVKVGDYPPVFRGFHLENVHCKNATKVAVDCSGLTNQTLQNITLKNVTIDATPSPLKVAHIENFKLERVTANGESLSR